MKKLSYILPFVSAAAFAAVDPTTVKVSGDWSNPLTWGETAGTEIATTASAVSFASSGLLLNADVTATITSMNLGGSTADYTSNVYSISASDGKVLTVSGFNSAMTSSLKRTVNIGSATNTGSVIIPSLRASKAFKNTIVNANGGSVQFNDLGIFNSSFYVNNGASVKLTSSGFGTFNASGSKLYLQNGSFTSGNAVCGYLELAQNGTLNVLTGVRILNTNSSINGTVNVSGGGIDGTSVKGNDGLTYNTRNFMFRLGNGTNQTYVGDGNTKISLGSDAFVRQVSTDTSKINDILVNATVTSAKNALGFQNSLHLAGNGILNLNSTDAFCQIDANKNTIATQGAMTLNISRHYNDASVTSGVYGADVGINLGADNNWGAFSFGSNTKLTLTLNGYNLVLGEINTQSGSNGSFTFQLADYYEFNNNFRITSMSESEIKAIKFFDNSGVQLVENMDYFVVKASEGGYWINSTIPEPSEWASIFGVFALGLALYRRRK